MKTTAAPGSMSSSTSKPSSRGIWMSSRTTSGRVSATTRTASKPSAHSPTTSIPGSAARSRRRPRRASSSSSTITTRSVPVPSGMRSSLGRGDRRQRQTHREGGGGPFHLETRRVTVERSQTPADIIDPETGPPPPGPFRVARIGHLDRQDAAGSTRRQPQRSAAGELGDAVTHGVLDERLQDERRHEAGGGFLVDRLLDRQTRAEAHLLDRQVVVDQGALLRQRDAVARAERQAAPQETGEQQAHAPRRRG